MRSTARRRKVPQGESDKEWLTNDILTLVETYGRYGYRM